MKNQTVAGLNEVLEAMGAPIRKDTDAAAESGLFGAGEIDREALAKYVLQDVECALYVDEHTIDTPAGEHARWVAHQEVNDRGVMVDRAALVRAKELAAQVEGEAKDTVLELTGLKATQVAKLGDWAKSKGVDMPDFRAETIDLKLAAHEAGTEKLPTDVHAVFEARKSMSFGLAKKLDGLEQRLCDDDRLRGTFVHHQARTGRSSSRGFNLQNLARPKELSRDEQNLFLTDLAEGMPAGQLEIMHGNKYRALLDSVRGLLIAPPGWLLASSDLSKAEPTTGTWFTGEKDHPRAYFIAASKVDGTPQEQIQKDTAAYQVGKMAVLATTYNVGAPTLHAQIQARGLKVSLKTVEAVLTAARELKKETFRFGDRVVRALAIAVTQRREIVLGSARGLRMEYDPKRDAAYIWLPSGRPVVFRKPTVNTSVGYDGRNRYDFEYRVGKKTVRMHKGIALENVISGTARDYLYDGLARVTQAGIRAVAHVHDQVVAEVRSEEEAQLMNDLLSQPPAWAPDLHITADFDVGPRFSK